MNKTRTIKSASCYITLTSSSTKNINRIPYPLIDNALEATGLKDQVEINYRAYELVPNGETKPTITMLKGLSKRTGMPVANLRQQIQGTIDSAASLGLDYRYDNMM